MLKWNGSAPASGEDTELNMTPMIDIVFQLIIFFLLTLKFKTLDRRIESMLPKHAGLIKTPAPVPDETKIKIKVYRRDVADRAQAHTLIRVDNTADFSLPRGWKGRSHESADRIARYDATLAAVETLVRRKLAGFGALPEKVKGEIVAPPPKGGQVPHGDVLGVLNVFLKTGLTDVMFEGASAPR